MRVSASIRVHCSHLSVLRALSAYVCLKYLLRGAGYLPHHYFAYAPPCFVLLNNLITSCMAQEFEEYHGQGRPWGVLVSPRRRNHLYWPLVHTPVLPDRRPLEEAEMPSGEAKLVKCEDSPRRILLHYPVEDLENLLPVDHIEGEMRVIPCRVRIRICTVSRESHEIIRSEIRGLVWHNPKPFVCVE